MRVDLIDLILLYYFRPTMVLRKSYFIIKNPFACIAGGLQTA
jgi:hypothetical protein